MSGTVMTFFFGDPKREKGSGVMRISSEVRNPVRNRRNERTLVSDTAKLDINKVDLELLGGLDTNQKRGTTTGGNNLVGEVDRLEDHGKSTLLLHSREQTRVTFAQKRES